MKNIFISAILLIYLSIYSVAGAQTCPSCRITGAVSVGPDVVDYFEFYTNETSRTLQAAYEAYIKPLDQLGQLDIPHKELLLEIRSLLEKKKPHD